jgi:hypothetical protein
MMDADLFLTIGLATRVVLGLAVLIPAALIVARKRGDLRRMRAAPTFEELLGLALRDRGLNAFMTRLAEVRHNDAQTRHHLVSAALLRHVRGPHPLLWGLAFVYAAWSVLGGIGGGGIRVGLNAIRGFSAVASAPPDMKMQMFAEIIESMAAPLQAGAILAVVGVVLSALVFALLEAGSTLRDREDVLGIIEGLGALDYPTEVRRLNVWGRRLRPLGWLGAAVVLAALGSAIPMTSTLPLADGTFYFTERPTASSNSVQIGFGAQLSLAESTARGEPVDTVAVTVGADYILVDEQSVMETARLPAPGKVAWPKRARYPDALVPDAIDEKLAEGRAHQKRVRSFNPELPVLTTAGLVVDATRPFREVAPVLLGCFKHGYLSLQAITRVRDTHNLAGFVPMKLLAPDELIGARDKKTECDATGNLWVDEGATWQMVIDAASAIGKPVHLVPVAKGTPGAPALAERCYTVIEID